MTSTDSFRDERPDSPSPPPHSLELARRQSELTERIDAISWPHFPTAYSSRGDWVPLDLKLLLFGNEAQAYHATHRLWCGLCHQKAYMSPAAEPALEFLLEALEESNDQLQNEILDILHGFAWTSDRTVEPGKEFTNRVRDGLHRSRLFFEELARSPNEEIAGFAQEICDDLESDHAAQVEDTNAGNPPG